MAYYVLKPVREALILGEGSAELKSYLSAARSWCSRSSCRSTAGWSPSYARMRLINVVTVFFAVCPVIFYVLAQFGVPLAVVFFVWIGIFSLMIIAQFWAFANDVYTKEEGERLFVIVGFGASLGAVAGARIADRLIEPLGVYQLMLLGAAILLGQLWLTNYINAREARPAPAARREGRGAGGGEAVGQQRLRDGVPHALPAAHGADADARQLGEHDRRIHPRQHRQGHRRRDLVAQGQNGGLTEEQLIGDFYSKYFTLVNVFGLLLQLFVVSRVVKYLGMSWAVMILPIISLGAYNILVFLPTLWAVLAAKVAENSTDYSLNNTVRNMLFLPVHLRAEVQRQAGDRLVLRAHGRRAVGAAGVRGHVGLGAAAARVCRHQRAARGDLAGAGVARGPLLPAADGCRRRAVVV